jgi:NAD+--asparagine ADP-ribosyltransferase
MDTENELIIENPETIETAVAEPKKRTYMREYKRKQYQENGEMIRDKNKAYYYKYKFGLNGDDMKKYDTLLPLVSKTKKHLDDLKNANPLFLAEILKQYV